MKCTCGKNWTPSSLDTRCPFCGADFFITQPIKRLEANPLYPVSPPVRHKKLLEKSKSTVNTDTEEDNFTPIATGIMMTGLGIAAGTVGLVGTALLAGGIGIPLLLGGIAGAAKKHNHNNNNR